MIRAWTHLRRLVASLMLVAVTSFVLHGGALAAHHTGGQVSIDCAASAHHAHHDGDDHGHGHHHAHAAPDDGSGAKADSKGDGKGSPCCTGLCALVLAPVAPDTGSAPMVPERIGEGVSRLDPGVEPGGLIRPPRTTDIAA
ncbi:hypothetical protein [Salinarimonas soli]|uniref:DUF2946 domain-containing protein n=1 Tax=Salinarimonas soli TaxID=1638099 RepID=A0A5B2VVA8_9HYPH|nr:hypothetical protein [Salinarimonas soli]KAA2242252.1 hypothetical protein F0L46_02905 [Salinarimonas soli]